MRCPLFISSVLKCVIIFTTQSEGSAFLVGNVARKASSPSSALLSHEASSAQQNQVSSPWRRRFGSAAVALMLLHIDLPVAHSVEESNYSDAATPLLQVTVVTAANDNLQQPQLEDYDDNNDGKNALYITVRPNSPDNVPKAILDGSRGKPPPVLIARIPNVTMFPLTYTLTAKDVTVEGSIGATEDGTFWWQGKGLVVSARLDSDGVAATRDPNDLVGRTIVPGAGGTHNDENKATTVKLQGRGPAGKLFTAKSSTPKA